MKRFVLFLLFCQVTIFGGFAAQTMVKTDHGDVAIEDLSVGDNVICCDAQNKDTHSNDVMREIIYKRVCKAQECVCIVIDGARIITAPLQKLYVTNAQQWKLARDLVVGDILLGEGHTLISVQEIINQEEEQDLYDIVVKDFHNFLVLKNGILVHNFAPAIGVGLAWFVGTGGLEFAGASIILGAAQIGLATVAGWFGYKRLSQPPAEDYWKQNLAGSTPVVMNDAMMPATETYAVPIAYPCAAVVASLEYQEPLPIGRVAEAVGTAIAIGVVEKIAKPKNKPKFSIDEESKPEEESVSAPKAEEKKEKECHFHKGCYRIHPYGLYHVVGYHHQNSRGGKKGGKSPAPIDGQSALDISVLISEKKRVGVSCGEIVELRRTGPGTCNGIPVIYWHGHILKWKEVDLKLQSLMERLNWTDKKGRVLI